MMVMTLLPFTVLVFVLIASMCEAKGAHFYTDLEDQPNPSWYSLKQRLEVGTNSIGPALGSTIQINPEEILQGAYANREIVRPLGLHTVTSSFVAPRSFGNQTRWYQEADSTQIFRMFPGDDTIRNDRVNAPRSEAFSTVSWKLGDGWYEWSGRYTFVQVRPGAVLQIKHNSTYWSMQLILEENLDGTFDLFYVKLRDKAAKTLLMEDVVGKGVDIKVLDDGANHKVFVEGELLVENSMTDRPIEDDNRARWGLYSPLSAMDRDVLLFVTGAWVGRADEYDPLVFSDRNDDTEGGLKLPPSWSKEWLDLDADPDPALEKHFYESEENEGNGFL